MRADDAFDPSFLIVNDFREHVRDDNSFEYMLALTNEMKAYRQNIGVPLRVGFIAPQDISFGTARMFTTLMSTLEGAVIVVERSVDALAASFALDAASVALLNDV
ncbi:MAG: hypothetical protein AAFN94_12845 [Pseudomonadota bacterium]